MIDELSTRDGFQGLAVGLPFEAVLPVGEYADKKACYSGTIISGVLHVTHFSHPKEGYKHEGRNEFPGNSTRSVVTG